MTTPVTRQHHLHRHTTACLDRVLLDAGPVPALGHNMLLIDAALGALAALLRGR